ncbi:MAG: hypothetical protein HQM00_11740 [Magnetococcales bacterium]|nr:hypothetical protein [Magnetococcales bacterium]
MKPQQTFTGFLADLRSGKTLEELDAAMIDMAEMVSETQKPGTITLTLKFKPMRRGNTMEITDTVKTVLPQYDRGADIFFVTPENHLTRYMPRQQDLPLEAVDQAVVPLRKAQ